MDRLDWHRLCQKPGSPSLSRNYKQQERSPARLVSGFVLYGDNHRWPFTESSSIAVPASLLGKSVFGVMRRSLVLPADVSLVKRSVSSSRSSHPRRTDQRGTSRNRSICSPINSPSLCVHPTYSSYRLFWSIMSQGACKPPLPLPFLLLPFVCNSSDELSKHNATAWAHRGRCSSVLFSRLGVGDKQSRIGQNALLFARPPHFRSIAPGEHDREGMRTSRLLH